MTAGVVWCLAG